MDQLYTNTRFLLEIVRSVNQASNPLNDLIKRLRKDVDAIEELADRISNEIDDRMRSEVLKLHDIDPEDLHSADALNDIISNYVFNDSGNIDSCLDDLREKIDETKRRLK